MKQILILILIFFSLYTSSQDTIYHKKFESGNTSGIIINNEDSYFAQAFNQQGIEIFKRKLIKNDSICKIELLHYDSGAVKQIIIINTDKPGTLIEETIDFDENGLNKSAVIKRHFDRNIEIRSEQQELKKEGIILKSGKK
jgi:hypothetical protein